MMTLEHAKERSLKTIESLKDFFQRDAIAWLEDCYKQNKPVVIYKGLRSCEEQQEMFTWGRTKVNPNTGPKPGLPFGRIVTKALPGQSFHQYGLAFDFFCLEKHDKSGLYLDVWNDKLLFAEVSKIGELYNLAPLAWETGHLQCALYPKYTDLVKEFGEAC